jgi:tetratricopeptide (TPR) repeat protein
MPNDVTVKFVRFLQAYAADPNSPLPLLWVGAGASAAAGYPTLNQLRKALQDELSLAEGESDPIEAYVRRFSRMDLMNFLENKFGQTKAFAPLHLAIAQLATTGLFHCVITTNYDRLIENALESLNAPYTLQIISQNQGLSSRRVPLVIKLHGDRSNWKEAVLDTASYSRFETDEPLVAMQLDLLRRGHPVIFLGCSMQDSRIVNWLRGLSPKERKLLHAGRVIITEQDWQSIPIIDRELFEEASVQPVLLNNHREIGELMLEVSSKLAPIVVDHLAFDLNADEKQWTINGPTHEQVTHHADNPLEDQALLNDLAKLEVVSRESVSEQGAQRSNQEAAQWNIATRIGKRLTYILLSDEARRAVSYRINQVDKTRPRLIVRVSGNSVGDRWALALPWELLTLEEGVFPVFQGQLEIVREVIVNESPFLMAPTSPLTMAVCISAPHEQEDKPGFAYEEESYHLARAVDQVGSRPIFAELGELKDLVELIERTKPSVIHFSGQGIDESLVFENEEGFPRLVPASELSRRLNEKLRPANRPGQLPRLFFLSHRGTNIRFQLRDADEETEPAQTSNFSPGASVAMALHRSGFVQVVELSGASFDALRVQAEETFYAALAQGETTLQAVALARPELSQSIKNNGHLVKYPLAWIHLRFYHRGPDRPLAVTHGVGPQELVQAFHRSAIEVGGLPVLEFGFIGRRSLQHEVRRKYQNGRRLFVIQGLGGIGKTALATQLVHRTFHSAEDDVLVFRCEGLEINSAVSSLKEQAVEHGRRVRIEGWEKVAGDIVERFKDPAEALEQVIFQLRRSLPRLIIYGDGIECLLGGPNNLRAETGEWLPETISLLDTLTKVSDRGLLILLSSRSLWKDHDPESVIFVDALTSGEIMRMFDSFAELSHLNFEIKERLIPRIDGHPRTVEFLDRLIHVRRLKLGSPLEELDLWTDLISPTLPDTREKITADMLLEALWQLLTEAGREHAHTLLVARAPLPRQVVKWAGSATDELIRFGLLTRHRIHRQLEEDSHWENRWAMHSIVADYVRTKVAPQYSAEAAHRLLGLGYKNFLESKGSSFNDLAEGVYHLHSANEGDLAWPLTRTYVHELQAKGDFLKALVSLDECERANVSGDSLASLLVTKSHIIIEVTEDHSKVVPLLSRALLLATSPMTREAALRARGIQLRGERRLEESEIDLRHSLRLLEITGGKETLGYAMCMHELAVTVAARGQLLKAQELLDQSLIIKAETCGKEHHLYASGLHELGLLAMASQDYERAEPLLREAVAIKRTALGSFHRSYGHSLSALADILANLGREKESETVSVEAHAAEAYMPGTKADSALFFAPDISYPNRLRAIAAMLASEGREAEAAKVRDVLKAMGEDETLPFQRTSPGNPIAAEIEEAFREADRLIASGLQEDVISVFQSIAEKVLLLEESQGRTRGRVLYQLGEAYRVIERLGESETHLRESLRITKEYQGEYHPDFAICLGSLAETLSHQGRHDESYPLYKEALRLLGKALGGEHQLYIKYLRLYSTALSIGMQLGEAEIKWRELICHHEKVEGEGYLQHARDLREVAALLARQEKFSEADEVMTRAIDIALRSHGPESEEYVETLWGSAYIGLRLGKAEALNSLPEVVALVYKCLPSDNPIRREALSVGMLHGIQCGGTGPGDETVRMNEFLDFHNQMMKSGRLTLDEQEVFQQRLQGASKCTNPLDAIEICQAVVSEAAAVGEIMTQLSGHDLLAQIMISLGRRDEALNHAHQAREIAGRTGHDVLVESAEERIAEIEGQNNNPRAQLAGRMVELSEMTNRSEFEEAVTFGKQLITEAELLGSLDILVSASGLVSSALEMMGNTKEALIAAQCALTGVQKLNHAEGIVHFRARVEKLQSLSPTQSKVNELLYRAQLLRASTRDALDIISLCEEALPLAESLNNIRNQWSVHKMLAEVFAKVGMKEEALDHAQLCTEISQKEGDEDLEIESQMLLKKIKEHERSAADVVSGKFFRALRLRSQEEAASALEEVVAEAQELAINNIIVPPPKLDS